MDSGRNTEVLIQAPSAGIGPSSVFKRLCLISRGLPALNVSCCCIPLRRHTPPPPHPILVCPSSKQLAVSFLHYSEIQVFDLEDILPGADATPVLTLSPGGGTPGPGSRARGNGFVGMGRIGSLSRSGSGGGVGTSRGSGGQRGLGQLSLEFVLRGATTGRRVSHLVAGGRGGMFRVWRLGPTSTGHLTPYLQVGESEIIFPGAEGWGGGGGGRSAP